MMNSPAKPTGEHVFIYASIFMRLSITLMYLPLGFPKMNLATALEKAIAAGQVGIRNNIAYLTNSGLAKARQFEVIRNLLDFIGADPLTEVATLYSEYTELKNQGVRAYAGISTDKGILVRPVYPDEDLEVDELADLQAKGKIHRDFVAWHGGHIELAWLAEDKYKSPFSKSIAWTVSIPKDASKPAVLTGRSRGVNYDNGVRNEKGGRGVAPNSHLSKVAARLESLLGRKVQPKFDEPGY